METHFTPVQSLTIRDGRMLRLPTYRSKYAQGFEGHHYQHGAAA
jgi:hypothetical protein